MKRQASEILQLRPLADCVTQAYISQRMQVADLLEWILQQTGPADVRISSFSVAEEFLRRMFFLRKDFAVRSLEIVLDLKATNKTLILWPFIAQTVENCFLSSNHSKVMLVRGESLSVAVVMSQNLTRGNRFETACVSTDPEVYRALDSDFSDIVNNHSVPFNEIYLSTIGSDTAAGVDLSQAHGNGNTSGRAGTGVQTGHKDS